jgi:hypothetical protein
MALLSWVLWFIITHKDANEGMGLGSVFSFEAPRGEACDLSSFDSIPFLIVPCHVSLCKLTVLHQSQQDRVLQQDQSSNLL